MEFLLEEEKKMIQINKEQGRPGGTPSYNMKSRQGNQPVFETTSLRITEMMLHFNDLEVTSEEGRPLLWECAWRGLINKTVAERLRGQIGQRWKGVFDSRETLPLEIGEHGWTLRV